METRKHFELHVHENTTYIEILGMQLESTQGKLVAFKVYVRKEKLQIN